MTIVLYPGTFNPIHNGHADLVERAALIFDKVVLGIATSPHKSPGNLQLRIDLANQALTHIKNVEVLGFEKLTVEFARDVGAQVILKGIRTMTDFEYEFQMLNMNRALQPGLETIFLAPSEKFSYISSTLVRQIAGLDGAFDAAFTGVAVACAVGTGSSCAAVSVSSACVTMIDAD